MEYQIDLREIKQKNIYSLGERFSGENPDGEKIGFTNYYMEKNGKPFFGISGEFHFSRCDERRWEDEILKMKMGGINVISTYVIWIHHEEIEGSFEFEGRRNLRAFLELCRKHDMYVILRVGPFAHGEVRNGGLPDWLYGKPFEVRSLDEGFLYYTRRYYEQIGKQIQGYLYKEGGPIIAAQIDNEYMHSCAPWEMTTGISNEWLPVGSDGNAYMLTLMETAKEAGIETPFYTCTGWGGAATPEEMMPLWGGYAYRPWIFYHGDIEKHPCTEEYVYQDFHKNGAEVTSDFHPMYEPETRPYACCEMGGGMMNTYNYRFVLPYKSVDAMANIKIGSGCNFVGYYVYQGGTNPDSKCWVYLNESQVPKLSYDYQAVLGEFGQTRESYHRLRTLHYFCKYFGGDLCGMQTVLPEGASKIDAEDLETLRFAVRTDGTSGFLFLNNFQDHIENRRMEENSVKILFNGQRYVGFEKLRLEAEENCILPFQINLDGILLEKATAQPVARLTADGQIRYIFMQPEGQQGEFWFEEDAEIKENEQWREKDSNKFLAKEFVVRKNGQKITILCVSRKLADQMYILKDETVLFTKGTVMEEDDSIRMETGSEEEMVLSYPKKSFRRSDLSELIREYGKDAENLFDCWKTVAEKRKVGYSIKQISDHRYLVHFQKNYMEGLKELLFTVRYTGDIGMAFVDGKLVHDNFANGDVWQIGLASLEEQLKSQPLTLVITPLKEGANVNVESAMAGRKETVETLVGGIKSIELRTVYERRLA